MGPSELRVRIENRNDVADVHVSGGVRDATAKSCKHIHQFGNFNAPRHLAGTAAIDILCLENDGTITECFSGVDTFAVDGEYLTVQGILMLTFGPPFLLGLHIRLIFPFPRLEAGAFLLLHTRFAMERRLAPLASRLSHLVDQIRQMSIGAVWRGIPGSVDAPIFRLGITVPPDVLADRIEPRNTARPLAKR